MPLLNSIKKHLKTLLSSKVTVESKLVAYYEGYAPEHAVSSNLIFTAGNIAIERGIYDSKIKRGYKVTIPIYCNYRGEKTPINDKFTQDVFDILYKSLNSGSNIDSYMIVKSDISSTHITMRDENGNYIQNLLTCVVEVVEV